MFLSDRTAHPLQPVSSSPIEVFSFSRSWLSARNAVLEALPPLRYT
jgi:hypothetical protein